MTNLYRARPAVVEACQLTSSTSTAREIAVWCGGRVSVGAGVTLVTIPRPRITSWGGDIAAMENRTARLPSDWIVKHPDGTFEVVADADFTRRYQLDDMEA